MRSLADADRVALLLRTHGFALASETDVGDYVYQRPGALPELYEGVGVKCYGRKGECAGAQLYVSIGYECGAWGFSAERYFLEPDPDPDAANNCFRNREEAETWESRLAELAPDAVRRFALEKGPAILDRTVELRRVVPLYLERFGIASWRQWRELLDRLAPLATPEQRALARSISLNERGPVVPLWNASGVFEAVTLGVMVYGPQLEGRQFAPPGVEVWPVRIRDGRVVDPAPDQKDWSGWQLAWRIELLADRLLGQYPDIIPGQLPALL